MVETNDFEWSCLVNTPERQKTADDRFARERQLQQIIQEDQDRREKLEFLSDFYDKAELRRKKRVEIQAARYIVSALACVVVCVLCVGKANFPALAAGSAAVIFLLLATFGIGMMHEMNRGKRRSASRSASPESGGQENIDTDTVTECEGEVNGEC